MDQMGPYMKIGMTVMPFIMFPITMNFPAAVTFYWMTTNIVSLCQAQIFKVQSLRKMLKIPIMIKHPTIVLPGGKKKAGFKQTYCLIILTFIFSRDLKNPSEIHLTTGRCKEPLMIEELMMSSSLEMLDLLNLSRLLNMIQPNLWL